MAELKNKTVELAEVVSRNPEIHSGDLVFSGTRVPVETLVDCLTRGFFDWGVPRVFPYRRALAG